MSAGGDGSVYWCHRCYRSIRLTPADAMLCPNCNGGFIEEIGETGSILRPGRAGLTEDGGRPSGAEVAEALSALLGHFQGLRMREMDVHRRRWEGHGHDRFSFNPWVIVRGQGPGLDGDNGNNMGFSLDNIAGIRRLPANVGDYFLGSGLEQLIEQLSQNDRCGPPPASRRAIDAMPTITITQRHMLTDSHCPVCKEKFEVGGSAREMPCKHIYHSDCILPWLGQHNSCPVCRHELPNEDQEEVQGRARARNPPPVPAGQGNAGESGAPIGLTILGLPGGGFAVGTLTGGNSGTRNSSAGLASAARSDNDNLAGRDHGAAGRNANSRENQSRRNPFSFRWPFRSANSNS